MLPPLHNFPAGIADGCGGPLMGPQVPFERFWCNFWDGFLRVLGAIKLSNIEAESLNVRES